LQINGAKLTVSSLNGSSLVVGGSTTTLNAVVKDPKNSAVVGSTVTFSVTDSKVLGLDKITAITDGNGLATATVTGIAAGSASVNVTALGNAKSYPFTVSTGTTFVIASPANNAVFVTGVPQPIVVTAPPGSTLSFNSTRGTFSGVVVNGGTYTANLTASTGGRADISVTDTNGHNASLVLFASPPASAANQITLTASPTTLPLASGSSTPSVRVAAQAKVSGQGVANVPILFSYTGGPNAGEYLTPAYQLTDSSGFAYADFYAGTVATPQDGIVVSAQIQNTAVQTGQAPSGNDLKLTIGGQAFSVAFGAASVLRESTDKTLYIQDYSVQVTDSNNNPVATTVTLRARPVAFSTGVACTVASTYCSEDANANGSLDAGEDGVRSVITVSTIGICPASNALPAPTAGKSDGQLTPLNSTGGAIPASVQTNSLGVASFSLTYLKSSALWIVDKISATVANSVTTESGSSLIFRLPASKDDVKVDSSGNVTDCTLPAQSSPYN
jgi:hypothetical protein